MDWSHLQDLWDAQQQAYLPDREDRISAMLDIVEVAAGPGPRILDLACGTGSITRRVLIRLPASSAVLVDVDPALLAIAAGTFEGESRVCICSADLRRASWRHALGEPDGAFDAVLTATALHWLPPGRVAGVYQEAAALLRSGGILANADHIVDEGLAVLEKPLRELAQARSQEVQLQTQALDWDGWWTMLKGQPELAPLVAERDEIFGHHEGSSHTESYLSSTWHLSALRAAGFSRTGIAWRRQADAVVVGVR